jgi:AraC family transcriptional regulator
MFSALHGFEPTGPAQSRIFDQMTVDYWQVEVRPEAAGRYVSMHPRFVLMLDDRRISLATDRARPPVPCLASYIPAGLEVWSRLDTPGPLRHLDIHLSSRRLKAIAGSDAARAAPVLLTDLGTLAPLAQALCDECREPARTADHAERLAQLVVLEVLHRGRAEAPAIAPVGQWLADLRAHVVANLNQRIAVDDLAAIAGMSRTHFNRRFREVAQCSPYQWVLGLRVDQARQLLRGQLPLAEVASITGFADQAHFSRVFKAMTGMAPGRWMNGQGTGEPDPNLQDKGIR